METCTANLKTKVMSNKPKPKIAKSLTKNRTVYSWDHGLIVFDKEEPRKKK